MSATVFYGCATVPNRPGPRRFGIVKVTRRPRIASDSPSPVPTVLVSNEWTGETFSKWKNATDRVEALNRELFPEMGR